MTQSIKDGGGKVEVNNLGGITINSREDKFVDITSEVRIGGSAVIRTLNFAADAGSTDAYAITMNPPITAYVTGQVFFFKANTANTGAATLAVNGLAAVPIKKLAGAITTVLDNNDIRAGQYVCVIYDGTNFQMLSASGVADQAAITNPAVGVGSGYKVARGEHTQVAASDTIVSGLATIISVVASPRTRTVKQLFFNASPGDQAGTPAAGSFLLTSQKPTAVNDVTPTAATDFTDGIVVDWIAVGT